MTATVLCQRPGCARPWVDDWERHVDMHICVDRLLCAAEELRILGEDRLADQLLAVAMKRARS